MKDYESGNWGFSLVWGVQASVFPRAVCLAVPNALITFILATFLREEHKDAESVDMSINLLAGFTSVMFFVLQFRSNIAYDRWWEGGTLLQKTRGEWFNAFSSLVAFGSTNPDLEFSTEEFQHLVTRLMSLLFCCALQQVSPCKDRSFEVIDLQGIDPDSLEYLSNAADKVEVILQWIQRATVLNMGTGVLPVAPPILSRAFQEMSRGIVNLQNARKIADFPFPFPYAQVSMVMLMVHWAFTPIACSMLFDSWAHQRVLASCVSFLVFFIWCINFIALQLESPFGDKDNDLPMVQMQRDWNQSLKVLLTKKGRAPPTFRFDPEVHRHCRIVSSDGSVLLRTRSWPASGNSRGLRPARYAWGEQDGADEAPLQQRHAASYQALPHRQRKSAIGIRGVAGIQFGMGASDGTASPRSSVSPALEGDGSAVQRKRFPAADSDSSSQEGGLVVPRTSPPKLAVQSESSSHEDDSTLREPKLSETIPKASLSIDRNPLNNAEAASTSTDPTNLESPRPLPKRSLEEDTPASTNAWQCAQDVEANAWQDQMLSVIDRIKESHSRMINEELDVLSVFLSQSGCRGAADIQGLAAL